ncbi:hypothetical protein GCM10023149_12780 [Mucilaginibacter gynuensis]|uniref:Bacterial sugar transferase domain-containing protein n=1 Tax=Mucilaginibacter gynuensis TaxID=1302236 RepID=A0ABP8G2X9_9SPHI
MADNSATSTQIIALVNCDDTVADVFYSSNLEHREIIRFTNGMDLVSRWTDQNINIVAIISQSEIMAPAGVPLLETLKKKGLDKVPFFLIVTHLSANLRKLALGAGVVDAFRLPFKQEAIEKRVNFLINNWNGIKGNLTAKTPAIKKTPLGKRVFDVFFAGMALLCLSPFLLIVYIAIKLESRGPAFYYSLRVGTGYSVFKFYKFRSMYVNSDQRIKDLKHLNQYAIDAAGKNVETEAEDNTSFLCTECTAYGKCQYPLHADTVTWCEKQYIDSKKSGADSAFFKIKNDPRITKVGDFIRNTSIDELPQLWNVIIGDMSIVGNRPLPLYEAEKLTTDKYALRFAAPAGITGLWQVEKRGKGEMSEDERLMLDNVYAQNHSLWNDMRVILKTVPALFQKENV